MYQVYTVIRDDLKMSVGKISAQRGHARADLNFSLFGKDEKTYQDFQKSSKIFHEMKTKNETDLLTVYSLAKGANLNCSLVIDQDPAIMVLNNGKPVATALAIGPCSVEDVKHIVGFFYL